MSDIVLRRPFRRLAFLAPLSIGVQVLNALLLPIVLGFLYLLARQALPDPYRLKGGYAVAVGGIILVTAGFGGRRRPLEPGVLRRALFCRDMRSPTRDHRHPPVMKEEFVSTRRKTTKRRPPAPLPVMLAELALSSWETIAHRTVMMACGSCSGAEYQRMFWEKVTAAQLSSLALLAPASAETMGHMLKPWHRSAVANARRLRRR